MRSYWFASVLMVMGFVSCSSSSSRSTNSDGAGGGGTSGSGGVSGGSGGADGSTGGASGGSGATGGTGGAAGADAGCGWSRRFGGGGANIEGVLAKTDPSGAILVAGVFRGTVDFGGGNLTSPTNNLRDGWLLKLDSSGNHVWSKHLASSTDAELANVEISADAAGDVVVSFGFKGKVKLGTTELTSLGDFDVGLAKLSATGDWQWVRQLGGALEERAGAAAHGDGSIAVHGHFQSATLDFGGDAGLVTNTTTTNRDVFAARLDSTGAKIWAKGYGSGGNEIVWGTGAVDKAGNALWMAEFTGPGFALGGANCPSPTGAGSIVAKLDTNGGCMYRVFASPAADGGTGNLVLWYAQSAASLGAVVSGALFGNVVLSDASGQQTSLSGDGDADVAVIKLDVSGNVQYAKAFGDPGYTEVAGLALDAQDNVFVAGYSNGSIDFGGQKLSSTGGQEVFIAKLDPTLSHVASQRFGDAKDQYIGSLDVGPDGKLVAAGHFAGNLDFGNGPVLQSVGTNDLYVAKLCF